MDDGEDSIVLDAVDIVINCGLVNILAICGIVGNVINIVVLSRHGWRKDTTNILLISLAASDMAFEVTIIIRRIKCLVARFDPVEAATTETMMSVYVNVANRLIGGISLLLVCAISLERFMAVYFPFSVARIFTPQRAKVTALACLFNSVVWFIPAFGFYTYDWIFERSFNRTIAVFRLTDFYQSNYQAMNLLYYIIYNYIFWVFPLVIVLVLGLAIAVKIVRAGKTRKSLTSSPFVGYDVKVVKMLLIVCSVSFLVYFPPTVVHTYSFVKPNFIYLSKLHEFLIYFSDLLYTFNAAVNFLIYVTMSTKFSRTYRKLFCKYCH